MQINRIADVLPKALQTPKPERTKVISRPVRDPINRQAALAIAPNKNWITQPLPPEKLPAPRQSEIDSLVAELKIERNTSAQIKSELGARRAEVRQLKLRIEQLESELSKSKSIIAQLRDTIIQLEDIKL